MDDNDDDDDANDDDDNDELFHAFSLDCFHGSHHHHHHHHLSLNREGRWGTTDDFTTSFLYFSLFPTPLSYGTLRTPGLSIP